MKLRRAEDRTYHLIRGAPSASLTSMPAGPSPDDALQWRVYEWQPGGKPEEHAVSHLGPGAEGRVLLLDFGGPEAMLVAGAGVRRLPRGAGGEDLLRRASVGATAWEREMSRLVRWIQLPERLLEYTERLDRADSTSAVCECLAETVASVVGGYRALVLLRSAETDTLLTIEARHAATMDYYLSIPSHPRLWKPGVVHAAEARGDTGGPYDSLAPLFADTGAASVAMSPLGREGVVLLIERRQTRTFDAEDWNLFRNLLRQAEGAIARVRYVEELHRLSLTDPLTGVANRRRLEVVLEPAWAAAKRGRPLSVALVDIDHFKKINDERGHLAGDQTLQNVARVIREEARASDLVVRYGGDEFLILLPGESEASAHVLVGRIQRRLAGQVEISAGVAEYSPAYATPQDLLRVADESLYAVRRQIRWRGGDSKA